MASVENAGRRTVAGLRHQATAAVLVRLTGVLSMAPTIAVILLNYRRPQNIGRIVRLVREALPTAPIYIVDNGEDPAFRNRDDVPWDQVWLRTPPTNLGAGVRLELASQLPYDHFLAIDDDLFPSR